MIRFDASPNAPRLAPLQMGAPDILAWLLAKEPTAIGAWNELGSAQYVRAWTAAQTAGYDIVNDLYFAMVDTVERGGSEADFAKMVTPILKQKGWLGGDDGKIATRVALIYDTNLRMAREAGRWNRYQTTKAVFPYIRAIDVGDSRVRHPPKSPHSDHRAWGGIVLPADHPFWLTYWPPLGFRCRCATVQMSRSQFARFKGGLTSPEELAERIARLGPPIFLAPGASVAAKVDEAIKGANERRIPGEAPIDREKVIRGGVAQWERAQAGIRDQQLDDAIAEITAPAAPVEAREYVSPINRAPIAVEKRASINKRLTSEFSEAAQDSRYSAIEFRDRKQDQVGKSGLSSKFTDESASLIARLKAEVDDLADQLRLPRLRGFKTGTGKAIGDQGDGIMSLNPQWFNGFASSVGGGGNVALAKITAEREQIGARLAALRDRHDVVKEELRKLGMSGDEQWMRLYDEQSAILKEHEKLRKRDAVLWKEANVAKRSGDARAASTWKPGDDPEKRPFNAEAYFEDGLDKARLVMFHEFAHHIHQYMSRIGTYRQVRKQPLEVELLAIYREAMADAKGRQLSTYSTKNEFEYFAENFGAFAMGRTDLVDPRALKLIERLFREKR